MVAASVRRNWIWWAAMGLVAVGALVVGGRSDRAGAPSDDRLFALAGQLKCLQCVGESVAASQAPLAEQFREEIRAQMASGATDEEILDYFAERYGQQVLLTPPSRGAGWLVWLAPLVVLGGALVALVWVWPRWRAAGLEVGAGSGAGDEGTPDGLPATGEDPGGAPVLSGSVPAPSEGDDAPEAARRSSHRGVAVVAVIAFVALAGVLLVRGARPPEPSPGGAPVSSRDALARCRSTAMADPAGAVDCYSTVLERDPDNVEALSYRGWAHLRSDDPAAAAADLDRAVEIDPGYPDARAFRAVAAAGAGDFDAAASELAAFFESDPDGVAVSVVESEGLEQKVFIGRLDEPTAACWKQAAGQADGGAVDQAFLDALGTCLDQVLATDPTSADARFSRAVAEVGPDGDDAMATSLLDGLLSEDPDDADALGLLALVQIGSGDLDAAEDSIARLARLPRAPSAFLVGDLDTLRAALQAARNPGGAQDGGTADADVPDGG